MQPWVVQDDPVQAQPPVCLCADADEAAYRGIAEGLLLQALGPLAAAAAACAANSQLYSLLAAHNLGLPGVPVGAQSVPDCSRIAPPVHSPVEKDRVRLQVWLVPYCPS